MKKMKRTHRDRNPDPDITFSRYRIKSPDGNSWETNTGRQTITMKFSMLKMPGMM